MAKRNPKRSKPNILRRFYTWKYSGLLTTFPTIGAIVVLFLIWQSQLEFYDNFTCDGLIIYKINNKPLEDYPTYNELSDKSKEHYDNILNECQIDGYWYYHGTPVLLEDHEILSNKITATEQKSIFADNKDFGV
jgi:hypothetical protein